MNIPLLKYGWLRALLYSLVIYGIMTGLEKYFLQAAGILAITYLFRKYLDNQSFFSLGFRWSGYSKDASLGFFSAIAILGIGTLILVLQGYLSFTGVGYQNEILQTVIFLIVVAFVEEILFRGYLLNNLMQSMNRWVALPITALLFTLAHSGNTGVNILPILNVFVAGIFLGLYYIYAKNLWFCILFHFGWNVLQGPVLGYEVSGFVLTSILKQDLEGPTELTGGAFGFEGSVICLALILIFTLWFSLVFRSRYKIL